MATPFEVRNIQAQQPANPYEEGYFSKAAEGICVWTRAMSDYYGASKIVKPKLEALRLAEARLEDAERELEDIKQRMSSEYEMISLSEPTPMTSIIEMSLDGISYSNSTSNIWFGLEYTTDLVGGEWSDTEASGVMFWENNAGRVAFFISNSRRRKADLPRRVGAAGHLHFR